jgi:Flp pilus assembly protein CpaB
MAKVHAKQKRKAKTEISVTQGDPHLLLLDETDNVLVATRAMPVGTIIVIEGHPVALGTELALGHKVARRPIKAGEPVLKYGVTIGMASRPIDRGAHVHVHNIVSNYTRTHVIENL